MDAPNKLALATLRLALCSVYPNLTVGKLGDDVGTWTTEILPSSDDSLAAREMQRQFESVIDRVGEELTLIHSSGLEGVKEVSYHKILEATSTVLDQYSDILVASRDFEGKLPSDLHRLILPDLEAEWDGLTVQQSAPDTESADAPISEQARAYGRSALTLCCYALIAWTRLFPSDRSNAAWSTLATTTTLVEKSRGMLLEVRRAGVAGIGSWSRVVGTQRRDISSGLGQMELFGLSVERRFRRVPITVSYLAGRVSVQPDKPQSNGKRLDLLITNLASMSQQENPGSGIRLIITGKAGSGKTTAAQWLAFTTAQQGMQILSPQNRPLLPLFVRLREVMTSTRPPSDRRLLYSHQLQDEVSIRWLDECAKLVTPLILLDGWDELSADRRSGAEQWVNSLATRFPTAHIILTSRPEGLVDGAFSDQIFRHVTILPLKPNESIILARQWFKGLAEQLYASPDISLGDVEKARRELIQDLSTPTISDMADSPLITSMLCCLYAKGETAAPDRRGKLYGQVIIALLDARERERGSSTSDWKIFDVAKKEKLVGPIARIMAENAVMSLPIEHDPQSGLPAVSDIISGVLPILGRSTMEAQKWTEMALARSIILQRVSKNEAEFIHRSIQDYLAARSFRDDGDLETMYSLAQSGQLALLPFACYSAELETTDRIIGRILEELSTRPQSETRVILAILVECLGAATVVSPEIRARAERAIATIFPPRSEAEAKSLAALGNSAIPYLISSRIVDPSARSLAIETLSRIGSAEAMDELVNYARVATRSELDALSGGLERFDPEEYAIKVLSEIKLDVSITLSDADKLDAVGQLESMTSLTMDTARLNDTVAARAQRIPRLRSLQITNCDNVGSLDWTARIPTLRSISVTNSRGAHLVNDVGPSGLWAIHLDAASIGDVDWLTLIRHKTNLRVFSLLNVLSDDNLIIPTAAFSHLTTLTTFALSGNISVQSLKFLANNEKLSRLTLGFTLPEDEFANLLKCKNLRRLDVRLFNTSRNSGRLAGLSTLTELAISVAPPALVKELHKLTNLSSLHLRDTDFGPLRLTVPPAVENLTMTSCIFSEHFSEHPSSFDSNRFKGVRKFVWRDGKLSDLNFLRDMQALHDVDIEDNGSVASLAGLDYIPAGCSVRLVGTRWGLDEGPVHRLRTRCEVIYEPDYDTDTFAPGFWVDYGGS